MLPVDENIVNPDEIDSQSGNSSDDEALPEQLSSTPRMLPTQTLQWPTKIHWSVLDLFASAKGAWRPLLTFEYTGVLAR